MTISTTINLDISKEEEKIHIEDVNIDNLEIIDNTLQVYARNYETLFKSLFDSKIVLFNHRFEEGLDYSQIHWSIPIILEMF